MLLLLLLAKEGGRVSWSVGRQWLGEDKGLDAAHAAGQPQQPTEGGYSSGRSPSFSLCAAAAVVTVIVVLLCWCCWSCCCCCWALPLLLLFSLDAHYLLFLLSRLLLRLLAQDNATALGEENDDPVSVWMCVDVCISK